MMTALRFKYRDGRVPNLLLLAYIFGGWGLGVALLFPASVLLNLVGVLLVAHTLMLSGYLIHECIHDTIFADPAHNLHLAALLSWLNGGSVPGVARLRLKHLHHHTDRMDPVTWDVSAFVARRGSLFRRIVLGLEWLHLPAVEVLLRLECMTRPWRLPTWRHDRRRMATAVLARVGLFALLAAASPRAALLYVVAWVLFITGLRFFDAFHHTFELVVLPDYETRFEPPAEWDRAYEQANTCSNVVSLRHPLLNALIINFSFHNAHHAKPGIPWHRLPALDRKLYGEAPPQLRAAAPLLRDYHRYRVERVVATELPERPDVNIGAVAVSFLTL